MSDPVENTAADELQDDDSPGLIEYLSTGTAGAVVLVLLVLVCYATTARFGYIWADDVNLASNATLRTFGGLSRIWTDLAASPQFMPVTYMSFWAEVRLFGVNPVASHLINIILHAANVVLLWAVLRRLSVPGAWVVAAVFAAHPINTQAVAWVSERSTLLSLTFALAATLFFLRQTINFIAAPVVVIDGEKQPEGMRLGLPEHAGRLYALFFAMFALAVLSRPSMVVLPVVLGIVLWWKKGALVRRELLSLAAPLLVGAVVAALAAHIEHDSAAVGASGPEWALSLPQRLMLVGQTIGFYLMKIAFPYPLMFNYPRWDIAGSPLMWLPLVAVLAGVIAAIALKKIAGRALPAAVLIFVVTILPASGLVSFYMMRYGWVWDHQAYAAAIAPIALVVAAIATFARRLPPAVPSVVAVVVVAAFAAITANEYRPVKSSQANQKAQPYAIFNDMRSLWEITLQQNPHSWLAASEFGRWAIGKSNEDYSTYMNVGDAKRAASERKIALDRAKAWLNRAIELNKDCYEAYTYRGILDLQENNPNAALADFVSANQAAAAMHADSYIDPQAMFADVLVRRGDFEKAEQQMKDLQQLEPRFAARQPDTFARLRMQYGDMLLKQLKTPLAPTMPDHDSALVQQAMEQYVAAGSISPEYIPAKLKLASMLNEIDQSSAALEQLRDVLEQDHNNRDAKYLTAVVAQKIGDYEAAGAQLVNLLQMDPRYMPAHIKFAEILDLVGRKEEAVNELKATLQMAPNYQPARELLAKITATTQPSSQPTSAPATMPAMRPNP